MDIGKAIKLCRMQKNLSQSDLAKLADISISYLSLLERGKRDPNFSTVIRITQGLQIPLTLLIYLAEQPEFSKELNEKLSYAALRILD